MTRVLVLGAGGMLGHKLWQRFNDRFETWAAVRSDAAVYREAGLVREGRSLTGVEARHMGSVEDAMRAAKPDVVVNAVGIVKQLEAANDPVQSIEVNALFPHRLAALCGSAGARLIHISTDCVFSGAKGGYAEDDPPDPPDLYGRSKLLGEVSIDGTLTLRTSIIGRELTGTHGLVEWFLSNRGGRVKGFRRAVFSGLPTHALSDLIGDVMEGHSTLSGLYHVASDPIDKHALLCLLRDAYGAEIEVEPDDRVRIDRSLDGSSFKEATGYAPPSWEALVASMAADPTPYEQLRSAHGA